MRITIIAAIGLNRELGRDNQLIWHVPGDLKLFKKTTIGHTLIMGRRTFESVGFPLPSRTTIILSQQEDFKAEGCTVVSSLKEGILAAQKMGTKELFICGGARVYQESLGVAHRMLLSQIMASASADAFFPQWNMEQWQEVSRESYDGTSTSPAWDYVVWTSKISENM